jgi:hypothetical protein
MERAMGTGGMRSSGPKLLAAAAGAALVVIGVATPLRGSAFGEPTVLRPQRLAPISVSLPLAPSAHETLGWHPTSVDETRFGRPGPRTEGTAQRVESPAEASAELHRHVRVPSVLPEGLDEGPTTTLYSASSYSYILDLPKINAALAEAGIDDVQLPTSMHGARVVVNVPAGVGLVWADPEGDRRTGLQLTQRRAPSLSVPAEIDLASLRDLLLSDPRITALDPGAVEQLRAIEDWRSALPVPVVGEMSSMVSIDGTDGLLLSDQRTGRRTLVWRRGGDVFTLAGRFDAETLVSVASSLR